MTQVPTSASKVWRKIKGFFKRAWTSFKKILPFVGKVTKAVLPIIGGPAGAVAGQIIDAVNGIDTNIETTVTSADTTSLYGATLSSDYRSLMKFTFTPGVAILDGTNPVPLNSSKFDDYDDYAYV